MNVIYKIMNKNKKQNKTFGVAEISNLVIKSCARQHLAKLSNIINVS